MNLKEGFQMLSTNQIYHLGVHPGYSLFFFWMAGYHNQLFLDVFPSAILTLLLANYRFIDFHIVLWWI